MFGIDLWDVTLAPALAVALVAGVLSFLSPCVLPIVPPYLAFMAGAATVEEAGTTARGRTLAAAAFFVLGLSTVFLLLGFAASGLGRVMLAWQREMGILAGAVVTGFGLHFLGLLRLPFLYREARFAGPDAGGGAFSAYLLGLAFAFGWTPCIGPVLGTILGLAAQEGSVTRGMALMAAYAIGLGLPFLLAALFLSRALGVMALLKARMPLIEKAMGGLLVVVGVMMMTGAFSRFSFWLLEAFPVLGRIG